MRQWALALPLSRSTIMTLATLAFRWFGPLFRGDPAYERYIASNRAPIQELPALILRGSAQDLIAQWREEGFDLRARQAARVTVFVPTFGQFSPHACMPWLAVSMPRRTGLQRPGG